VVAIQRKLKKLPNENPYVRALYKKGEGWYLVDKDGNFVRMINRVEEVSIAIP
jgi:hypothetical protein